MHYFIGGAFDPVTRAHETLFKLVSKKCKQNDVLHICITDNDEKNYYEDAGRRASMVCAALNAHNIIYKLHYQDERLYNFLQNFAIDKNDITIVLGSDEWNALVQNKWQCSKQLLSTYKFLVLYRENISIAYHATANVTTLAYKKSSDISSTAVREILLKNPNCSYKDVSTYISKAVFNVIRTEGTFKTNGKKCDIFCDCLYYQNPLNYDELEQKFIAHYKKQGWGTFANTVDIVGYSNEQVLLIRRKRPPYMNYWCVPGGFFNPIEFTNKETGNMEAADASLEATAQREFKEETSIDLPIENFKQIKTYSHVFDPRLRIIDTAFFVKIKHSIAKKAKGDDDAAEAKWFKVTELPKLGFHHAELIQDGLDKFVQP